VSAAADSPAGGGTTSLIPPVFGPGARTAARAFLRPLLCTPLRPKCVIRLPAVASMEKSVGKPGCASAHMLPRAFYLGHMAERGREGGFDGVKDVREHLRAFSWACLKKNRRRLR
jgi:hypothetical protein